MNLSEIVKDFEGLRQDEWSLTTPTFGEDSQLTVVGWSGRNTSRNKFYILRCNRCKEDEELFGDGYFRSLKGSLVNGSVPCGCSKNHKWTKEQYAVLCKRKAEEIGYTFLGFIGGWRGAITNVAISCVRHGAWYTGIIDTFINTGRTCPTCGTEAAVEANTKPDDVMIASFHESGAFHPETKFWRSEKKTKVGAKSYWYVSCPECGEVGESFSGNLQQGNRPCACSKHKQTECYINLVLDNANPIAIKFGRTNNSKKRIKQQDKLSAYSIKQHSVYIFPDAVSCKKAERECLQELERGVVLKRDMPDGYTETTWTYNLEKIVEIYKRNGGVRK